MARAADEVRKKGTGTRRAYEKIRDEILSLSLRPGQGLDEGHFVEDLGISRTPVREALIQLSAEGLVELLPNRGARVSQVDLSTTREFFEALDVNQRMVTRWAAQRRTSADLRRIDEPRRAFEAAVRDSSLEGMMNTNLDFHSRIADACGNALVAKHYRNLLSLGLRLSRISLAYGSDPGGPGSPEHLARIVEEHRELMAHLVNGEADAAEAVARSHTETFRRRVSEFLTHSLSGDIAI